MTAAVPGRDGPVRIQALARASALLDVLAVAHGDWVTLAQLSRATALQKTTAHNLLASLRTLGFVEQDRATRMYRLGLRNLELGRIVQKRLTILSVVRPALMRLCAQTRETASLAVPDGLDVLVVDSLEGDQGLRVAAYAGTRMAFHLTACGKSILAHLAPEVRTAILHARPLEASTSRSHTDPQALEVELGKVRRDGYATNLEENEEGTVCVGAPIFGAFGEVAGAISVDAPAHRMSSKRIPKIAEQVVAVAKEASLMLGAETAPAAGSTR